MFPSASPRGTLRVSGKQNSLFPLGPVIKCLLAQLLGNIHFSREAVIFKTTEARIEFCASCSFHLAGSCPAGMVGKRLL